VVLDDALDKPTVSSCKRKRDAFADDEVVSFTHMTSAVKDDAHAIRDNKTNDMHLACTR
jgi:hypothetical protein